MDESTANQTRGRNAKRMLLVLLTLSLGVSFGVNWWAGIPLPNEGRANRYPHIWGGESLTNSLGRVVDVSYFWDRNRATNKFKISGGGHRNLRSTDYVGPGACRECHQDKYGDWENHAHRRMNQIASSDTVLANFDGTIQMDYLGGHARFTESEGKYRMDIWRDGKTNQFVIERTIGSRFFQRYTGRLISGSDAPEEGEFVLPFSWWIDQKEWVPATHIFAEVDSDHEHWDPYEEPFRISYDTGCAECHTTIPYGEVLIRSSGYLFASEFVPRSFHFGFSNTLAVSSVHLDAEESENETTWIMSALGRLNNYSTREHAVSLGISCEACHYGAREHVENSTRTETSVLPRFFPSDPDLFIDAASEKEAFGRSAANKNFMCGRCHVGGRPQFASGHHTWNSTEYSEAIAGNCYETSGKAGTPHRSLTCVHCHDPHVGTGKKWSRTRQQDNQSCLDCHEQFSNTEALTAHTYHDAQSIGSDCMGCHMPKINEGLQDMVRTHRIFSPTEPSMIEANQPNACNMCHVEQGVDWTLEHLKNWYGQEYDNAKIAAAYKDPGESVALSWARSEHSATRMVAADVLSKARAEWALPQLVENLDDSHMTNRQLLQRWLEEWVQRDFRELGYRSHQTPEERERPIKLVKEAVLGAVQ